MNNVDSVKKLFNFGIYMSGSQGEVVNALLNPKYTEVSLCAGRGWGKDIVLGIYTFMKCMQEPKTRILFICPFFNQVMNFFSQVYNGVNQVETDPFIGEYFIPHGSEDYQLFDIVGKEIRFRNGSIIRGVSADNPKSIRSFRADILILNEIEDIPEVVINTEILAVIKKFKPKMVYVGTPKGKRFFYKKFRQGLHEPTEKTKQYFDPTLLDPNSISFHRTYLDNPRSSANIELFRKNMSAVQFNQEVLAMFLDDSQVFTNLAESYFHIDLGLEFFINKWSIEPILKREGNNKTDGNKYVAGLDLAKEKDWSVLTIIDCSNGKVVYFERFQKMDYVIQAKKVLEICKKYNSAPLLFDTTGVGNAVADIFFNENKNPDQSVSGFLFTNDSKADLIQKLGIRIERDKEWIPAIPVIQSELQSLQIKRTDLGRPKYEAPEGQHDDCVMSLGLANLLYLENQDFRIISL